MMPSLIKFLWGKLRDGYRAVRPHSLTVCVGIHPDCAHRSGDYVVQHLARCWIRMKSAGNWGAFGAEGHSTGYLHRLVFLSLPVCQSNYFQMHFPLPAKIQFIINCFPWPGVSFSLPTVPFGSYLPCDFFQPQQAVVQLFFASSSLFKRGDTTHEIFFSCYLGWIPNKSALTYTKTKKNLWKIALWEWACLVPCTVPLPGHHRCSPLSWSRWSFACPLWCVTPCGLLPVGCEGKRNREWPFLPIVPSIWGKNSGPVLSIPCSMARDQPCTVVGSLFSFLPNSRPLLITHWDSTMTTRKLGDVTKITRNNLSLGVQPSLGHHWKG